MVSCPRASQAKNGREAMKPARWQVLGDVDLRAAYRGALQLLRDWSQRHTETTAETAALDPGRGRLLETLLTCGERRLGDRIVERLLTSQRADGSWAASATRSALRETADAIRGLS